MLRPNAVSRWVWRRRLSQTRYHVRWAPCTGHITYWCQERLGNESRPGVQLQVCQQCFCQSSRGLSYEKLHLGNLLIHFLHELDYKVDQLMLQHLLGVKVGDEERDIITLTAVSNVLPSPSPRPLPTLTGFLRRMKKASARCVKNLVNLCTRICSISSACLILMLTRMLLIDGSMSTLSFSFLEIVRGFNKTSGDVWASISGTLWRSEVWDAKFDKHKAEVREDRTHWRYGRND